VTPELVAVGWDAQWAALAAAHPGGEPARVLRHDGVALRVCAVGGVRAVPLLTSLAPVTVGDWLVLDGDRVLALLERRSLLRRRDPGRDREQLLAANVDLVLVVCGLDRPLKAGRIERTATLAWEAGATPVLVLTKADLLPRGENPVGDLELPGLDAHTVSVKAGPGGGLDALRELAAGRTLVMVGESGAGKSSLLNALLGAEAADTGPVRRGDAKGRHTTTTRELHPLPGGGCLIDSPGIREVGLWGDAEAVDDAFAEIEELASGCRFRDCGHTQEPGCAVLAAVETGELAAGRHADYLALRREAEAAELRGDPHSARRAGRRFGRVTREAQRMKRDR